MTCIAAVVHEDTVYVAGDSYCSWDYNSAEHAGAPKVFRVEEFVIGGAGWVRNLQLVQYVFKPPRIHSLDPSFVMRYMCTDFVGALQEILPSIGESSAGGIEDNGIHLVVGITNQLYMISSDYSVVVPKQPFTAIGSGREFALGALAATPHRKPEGRLLFALEFAAQSCPYVAPPYSIIDNASEY